MTANDIDWTLLTTSRYLQATLEEVREALSVALEMHATRNETDARREALIESLRQQLREVLAR